MKRQRRNPGPTSEGWFMPAEWTEHERCWMAWPTRARWRGFEKVCRTHSTIAHTIARFEPVVMVATPEQAAEAAALCGANVTVLPMPVDDLWIRDTGPSFLVNRRGESAGTSWHFNAWGGKHAAYEADARVAECILEHLDVERFAALLVNEGGAFSVDGEGTVLTTQSVLLNPNRNPDLSRGDIEELLLRYTGARKVVWLPGSLVETVTDGHVDGIAGFVRPGVVVAEMSNDPADPEYAILAENLRILRLATDAKGRRIEVLTLTRPPWNSLWPEDFASSYVNFYIANGAVIMPKFGHQRSDEAAVRTVTAAFPGRKIVPLRIDAIAAGGGGIHCVTQQQPPAAPGETTLRPKFRKRRSTYVH